MSSVVAQMRRTRRVRRLGSLEWFEVAYRVYLAALVGGGVVLWLSGLVSDEPASAAQVAWLNEHGPAVIGVGAALAIALGLRSGSDGGPISIEPPDVRHLLLAPVPRRDVLMLPVVQRLRSLTFVGALVGLVAGQLAARRLPGSGEAWAASAAVAARRDGRPVRRRCRDRPRPARAPLAGDHARPARARRPGPRDRRHDARSR